MRQAPLPLYPEVSDYRPPAPPDLSQFSVIDLDCESTGVSWQKGDRPVGIAVGAPQAKKTWYLPFAHRGGGNLSEESVRTWARRELRGKRIRNHSTRFDLHMTQSWGVDLREQDNTFHDVQHSAALLDDHRKRFALNVLAQDELGMSKIDVGPKDNIADLPARVVAPYAERDVELVARLADHYAPKLRAEGLETVSKLEDDVIPVVVEIERNGMPLDVELCERLNVEAARIEEQMQWDLERQVGFMVNPDRPDHMRRLFNLCGEPLQVVCRNKRCKGKIYALGTKTCVCDKELSDEPSFPNAVVQPAARRHDAILKAWRIGKLKDLRSKFLVKYRDSHVNGILYPHFNQLKSDDGGAVTGRFSGDMQQVMGADKYKRAYGWLSEYSPESFLIKRLFLPQEGDWCSADMKQVEYRTFVHYVFAVLKNERLIKFYRENPEVDFHHIVGGFILPLRPDITRTETKTANFLSMYMGGPGTLAAALDIDMPEAQELYNVYHEAFPEVKQLSAKARYKAETRGYLKSFLGRRCRFPDPDRIYTKALNSVIQPTAADANKLALVAAYKERKFLEIVMRMTTHDSLETDLRNRTKLDAYKELLNEQRMALSVPLLWDVNTGDRWSSCK